MAETRTKVKINEQKTLTILGAGENMEQVELGHICGANASWYRHLENGLAGSYKVSIHLPQDPATLPERNENVCAHKILYGNIYNSFIHSINRHISVKEHHSTIKRNERHIHGPSA